MARTQIMYPELCTDDAHAGVYQQIVELVKDIMEKQKQNALNDSQYKLKQDARNQLQRKHSALVKKGLNAIPQPVLIVDSHDRLQYSNSAAQALFKFTDSTEQNHINSILQDYSRLVDQITQTRVRH